MKAINPTPVKAVTAIEFYTWETMPQFLKDDAIRQGKRHLANWPGIIAVKTLEDFYG